jgi:hypothetical protein
VWGKLLLFLLLGVALVGLFAVGKPSEAELRQAIREKGKELQARGLLGPPALIDDPQYAGRFTYQAHFFTSEITFTTDSGKVVTVAVGQLGDINVKESW